MDCHWDCGVCGHHDLGYYYGVGCDSNDENHGLDESDRMGDGTVRVNGSGMVTWYP